MNATQAIQAAAKKYGIRDWRALAAVSHAESGLNPSAIGDGGSSFGLFQLHQGGALGNMPTSKARQYLDAYRNAEFAARKIREMGIHGLTGRDAIAAFVTKFERPANPTGEIERAYAWYTGQGKGLVPEAPVTTSPGSSSGPLQIGSGASPERFQFTQDLINRNAKQFKLPTITMPMPQFEAPAPIEAPTDPNSPTASAGPSGMFKGATGYPAAKKGKLIGSPNSGTHTLGNWQSDNAVDISLPVGTPIIAAQDGVVSDRFGSLGKGGRFAGLRMSLNGNGQSTYYAHLSKFAAGIKPGAKVRRGQIIGYSGSANGVAHLHFGVEYGNPYQYVGGAR